MVSRRLLLGLALLLAGCPDDFGKGGPAGVDGLVAPANLTATPNGGSEVTLTWTDRATTETGYRVEMNRGPFGMSLIADARFLGANATSLVYDTVPNATYYFRVVAITGTSESEPSETIVVTLPNVPGRPTLFARPNNPTNVHLTWSDLPGGTGFVVERRDSGGWTEIQTLPAGATACFSGGLQPDTEVAHRLIALNANGRSSPSPPALAMTTSGSVTFQNLPVAANDGLFTSLVVSDPGVQHIAHVDLERTNVLYSTWSSPLSPYQTTTVDAGPTGFQDVGGDGTSLAVEAISGHLSQRKSHIVSHDRTSNFLRYATDASGTWTASTIDVSSGARPRIARDPLNGALHVAYQGRQLGGPLVLRYATKPSGQGWITSDLAQIPVLASAVHALALDGSGMPHVLLVDATGILRHVLKKPPYLGGTETEVVPVPMNDSPDFVSMAIDVDGTLHAVYHGTVTRSLNHVWRLPSGVWGHGVIDEAPGEDLGSYCSLALQEGGWLFVAYYDATRKDLKFAYRAPGSRWFRYVVDAAADVGTHVSLAVPGNGYATFVYRDETFKRLKIALRPF